MHYYALDQPDANSAIAVRVSCGTCILNYRELFDEIWIAIRYVANMLVD